MAKTSYCSYAQLAQSNPIWYLGPFRSVFVKVNYLYMVTNEKQNLLITKCFIKTNESWIDYRALTKTGLLANIDELRNFDD